MKKRICLVAVLLVAPLWSQAQLWLGDWYPKVTLDVKYDDNVNRSYDGNGEKGEVMFHASLRAERQVQLDAYTYSHMGAVLSGTLHDKYSGLNLLAPGVDAGLRHQMGDGADAILLLGSVALRGEFYDQDFRIGALFTPRLEARKVFNNNMDAGVYYQYDNRFASDNEVYDIDGHTIGIDAEWTVSDQVVLMAGYSYRYGSSIVHQPLDDLGAEVKGKRFPVSTFGDRYAAVNLSDTDTHHIGVGLRYAVSLYTALHAGYAYEEIKGKGDSYPSSQFSIGLSHLL